MLDRIFLAICNMTLTGCFVIVFILLARLCLRKLPRIYSYALWIVAGLRLLIPFSFEAKRTLIPVKAEVISPEILIEDTPAIHSGIVILDEAVNGFLQPAEPIHELTTVNPAQLQIFVLACLWLLGLTVFVGYNLISLCLLRRRLRDADAIDADCFVSAHIDTPFVLGLLRPRIYLPATLNADERELILLHERAHLRRHDPLAKLIGFAALALHWFNPFVWLAFRCFERDMEMSCDEAVTRTMPDSRRADYSALLLSLSTGNRPAAPHLAFGESDTGARIKHVLSFKRPAVWICIIALIAVVAFGGAMLFSRAGDDPVDQGPPVTDDTPTTTDAPTTTAPTGIPPRRTPMPGEGESIVLSDKIEFVVYQVEFPNANQVMFEVTVDGGTTWNPVTRGDIPTGDAVGYYTRNFTTRPMYGSYEGDVIAFSLDGNTLVMTLTDELRDMTRSVYHSTDNGRTWTLVESTAPEYYNVPYSDVNLTLKVPSGWQLFNHGRLTDAQGNDAAYLTVYPEENAKPFSEDPEAQKQVLMNIINDYHVTAPVFKPIEMDVLQLTSSVTESSIDGVRAISGYIRYRFTTVEDPQIHLLTAFHHEGRNYYAVLNLLQNDYTDDDLRAMLRNGFSFSERKVTSEHGFSRLTITFPAYDLREGLHESWYIDPFEIILPLPFAWTIRVPDADERATAFGTPLYLYDGDKQVGTLRYDTATWIESGKGDYMMYFQGYMMGSIIAWDVDPEMVIDTGTAGVAITTKRVNQMDGIAAAASTVKYYPAMLCYLRNGDTIYQVAIEFAEDAFDRVTLRAIAESTTINFVAKTEN